VLDDLNDDDMEMVRALGRHSSAHRMEDFLAQGLRCGWCAHPIRLKGFILDDTRRVVFSSHEFPDNVVLKACGSRSELRCPSCATLYRGDARHLVRAGLEGGKGVDGAVVSHPAVFLTLTAPSFGAVHRETRSSPCHGKGRQHRTDGDDTIASESTHHRLPGTSTRAADQDRTGIISLEG
jgi:uncharacterized Zn-finger protein